MKLHHLFTSLVLSVSAATANESSAPQLAKSQQKWVKFYSKQNPLKPEQMLVNTDKEPSLTDGYTSLCNGKDLNNWTSFGGKHKYELKEGKIIEGTCVPGQASSYLSTNKNYTDFIFTCDFKWLEDMNTGVLFRSKSSIKKNKKGKERSTAKGPQVEMEGFAKPDRNWSGGIYGQGTGGWIYPLWLEQHEQARKAVKKEGWNRLTVLVDGETVKTWLNGTPAAHWKNTEFKEGFISLQVHSGKGGKVQFRDPKIKELPKK